MGKRGWGWGCEAGDARDSAGVTHTGAQKCEAAIQGDQPTDS